MSKDERLTNAHERAATFSSKNVSSEKTAAEKKDFPRILNFRRILFSLLVLSGLVTAGAIHGERNKDVNKALREAHQACEADYDDSAEILCDLTIEFERLKEITHKEHSTVLVSIAVQKNNKLVLDEWHYIRLYEVEPEDLRQKIDKIVSEMKALYSEQGLTVFGYAIYTQYVNEESDSLKKLLIVTQDYTASAHTNKEGQRALVSMHRVAMDLYVPSVTPASFPMSTIDLLYTHKGDKSRDGLQRVYPGMGGTLSLGKNQQSELINKYFKYLRPLEKEYYVKSVLDQDPIPKP